MFGKRKKKKENKKDVVDSEAVVGEIHTMSDDLTRTSKRKNDVAKTDVFVDDNKQLSSKSGEKESSPFLNIESNAAKIEPEPESKVKEFAATKFEPTRGKTNRDSNNIEAGEKSAMSSASENNYGQKRERMAHQDQQTQKGESAIVQPGTFDRQNNAGVASGIAKRNYLEENKQSASETMKSFDSEKPDKKVENSENQKMDKLVNRLKKLKEKKMRMNRKKYKKALEPDYATRHRKAFRLKMLIGGILIVVFAGGASYIWLNYGETVKNVFKVGKNEMMSLLGKDTDNKSDDDNSNSEEPKTTESEFSDKINYIIISEDEFNESGIREAISKKFGKMRPDGDKIFRFVLVDQDAVKMTFTEFSNAFNINLGADVARGLDDDFSLYLFKDENGDKRLVLSVKTVSNDIFNRMKGNENILISGIKTLFFDDVPDNLVGLFKDSEYRGHKIRYVNLKQTPNISVDYTVVGDYLIIATSKKSGRLTIDKVMEEIDSGMSEESNQLIDDNQETNNVLNDNDADEIIEPESDDSENGEAETVIIVD